MSRAKQLRECFFSGVRLDSSRQKKSAHALARAYGATSGRLYDLAAVAFTPSADNDVDTTIAVSIRGTAANEDGEHCGSRRVPRDDDEDGTITLEANPVNDVPAATNLDQTQTYAAGGASVPLDDIVVSDPDNDETITAVLTLADLTAGSVADTQGIGTYDAGTGHWTVTGSVSTVNAVLAGLVFTPAAGTTTNTTIAVTIRDAAGTGPDGLITVAVTTALEDALRTAL